MRIGNFARATLAGILAAGAVSSAVARDISQRGLDMLKGSEGYSPTNYLCQAGKTTIGYGHVVKPGEKYKWLNEEDAENLLRQDVSWAENAVDRGVKVPLTQNQYDALVSFTFNLGVEALNSSTLLRKLNSGDYTGAADEFDRWVYFTNPKTGKKEKSNGLINRRAREKRLFLRD